MGHAGFGNTAYYVHLLPERLLSPVRIDWEKPTMSAVKSFLKYETGKDKSLIALYLDADAIPKKKDTKVHRIEFFSESALKTLLAQPDKRKKMGRGICFS